jgi:hypothetical protein
MIKLARLLTDSNYEPLPSPIYCSGQTKISTTESCTRIICGRSDQELHNYYREYPTGMLRLASKQV